LQQSHALKDLLKWKSQYANALEEWLHVIGEMLNSLANLSYNNPDFAVQASHGF
jgi:hypothetical protein